MNITDQKNQGFIAVIKDETSKAGIAKYIASYKGMRSHSLLNGSSRILWSAALSPPAPESLQTLRSAP
jgi:hypothetical protein